MKRHRPLPHDLFKPSGPRPSPPSLRLLLHPLRLTALLVGLLSAGVVGSVQSAGGDDPASDEGDRGQTRVQARTPASTGEVDTAEIFHQGQFAESTKDWAQAVRHYRRAARLGHAPSQNNLGFLLLRGLGCDRNAQEAVKWFRDAARQGYAAAQNNLGVCYRDGEGVKEDAAAAAKWFLQAAEQGMAEAQNNLGVRFYRGSGMPRNTDAAIEWFTKAADQGYPGAWINLGICHLEGRGRPKDFTKAFEYFCKAAEKGDADGLLNLGFAHMEGKGVPKDLVKAYVCFNTAVTYGDSYARQARSKLKGLMTEKQIAEANRLTYERANAR